MSSYKVSVGDATVRVKTLQEAGSVVMEALTSLLAQDPQGAAEGCHDGQPRVLRRHGSAGA